MDITTASAAQIATKIKDGTWDAVEVCDAFLEGCASHPAQDQIYARMTESRAREDAMAARSRAKLGQPLGPLDGVPISWKDLFDTAGVATESGSRLLEGRVPSQDALVLERATRAGLVCLGKTHQTELAFSGLGVNPQTATPPNALAPALAPGGSSSGAAVSTKLGLAAAGIGSDTGGSVRIPAAWNDLVGLKTTHGRLPLTGVVPLCARFDTIGPLTHTVEDAALVFAALDASKPVDLSAASLSGRRVLVLDAQVLTPVDEAPERALQDALSKLSSHGVVIDHAPAPMIDEALPASAILFTAEAYATWRHLIAPHGDKMFAPVRARFEAGKDLNAADYVAAWQMLERARAAFVDLIAGYDAVVLPTSPILPPDTAQLLADEAFFTERNLHALRNTRVGNLMGSAALTLPTDTPHCGLMLVGGPGDEAQLLRLGAAMEPVLRG
ncbi:MAG: amidase family protein [Pseudomonadota bacterium]